MRERLKSLLLHGGVLMLLGSASPAEARDYIRIVGSSTVYPFSTIVAERYGADGKFKTPVVESTGTGGGFKLFCSGVGENYPDIANASRPIKESEIALCKENGISEIVEVPIGNDGIVFANSRNSLKYQLTKEQLWKAMAAKGSKPKSWNEVDPKLPPFKITIFTPPPTSGTRDAWNELVMKAGCPTEVKAKNEKECELMREDGAVVEAGENDALLVQKVTADPEAFAIFGFSFLEGNSDKIKAAVIEGKEVSLESIQDGSYSIARPIYFYVKKSHLEVVPGLQEFVKEFTGNAAIGSEGYLVDAGLVPLDAKKLRSVRNIAATFEPMKTQ